MYSHSPIIQQLPNAAVQYPTFVSLRFLKFYFKKHIFLFSLLSKNLCKISLSLFISNFNYHLYIKSYFLSHYDYSSNILHIIFLHPDFLIIFSYYLYFLSFHFFLLTNAFFFFLRSNHSITTCIFLHIFFHIQKVTKDIQT